MNTGIRKALIALLVGATVASTAAPADARHRRHHRGDNDAALAIGAGIIGLGIGAAIASSRRGRYYDRYYDRGYYDYGYYDRGYYDRDYYDRDYYDRGYYRGYRGYRGHYRSRCYTRRVWDPYWGRRVRVRYCR